MPAISVCVEDIFEHLVNDEKMSSLFTRKDNRLISHRLYDKVEYNMTFNIYEVNKSISNPSLEHSLNHALRYSNIHWTKFITWLYTKRYYIEENTIAFKKLQPFTLRDHYNLYLLDEKKSELKLMLKYLQTKFKMHDHYKGQYCRFYVTNSQNGCEKLESCNKVFQVLNIVSPFGKCFTYFYNNKSNENYYKNTDLYSYYLTTIKCYNIHHSLINNYKKVERKRKLV